ncbi:hypothetical protein DV735_g1753, partial [Chaetothyriales sp. CBS 134920]
MSKHKLEDGAQIAKQDKKRRKKERKEALKTENPTPPATSAEPTAASTPVAEEQVDNSNVNGNADDNGTAYTQSAALSALADSEITAFYEENSIQISDPRSASTRPVLAFSHLPSSLSSPFSSFFSSFPRPTAIQSVAWPHLLSSRDVVGVAETGSGKTLAFGFPLVSLVSSLSKKKSIRALVVTPTRELAIQVFEQIQALCGFTSTTAARAACVYGGADKDTQRRALKHANILVATPGRLKDFISDGTVSVSKVRYVVLDEADRMLDKGFEDDIRHILSLMPSPPKRQTAMFTATWPKSIRDLASTFMKDPVRITIGQPIGSSDEPNSELRANPRIKQVVEVIDPADKQNRLFQLLKQHTAGPKKNDRILIFCLYKKEASRVHDTLARRGFSLAGIHGDLSQSARLAALNSFKSGTTNLLVATDVAARGLDIPEVKVVINHTFPLTAEDYVHRIGRTGRAGKDGLAITLFTEHDKALAGGLVNVLKSANQQVPEDLLRFGTTVKKKQHDAYGAFFKEDLEGKTATKVKFDD